MASLKRWIYRYFHLICGRCCSFDGLTTKSWCLTPYFGITMANELVSWVLYERWFSPCGSFNEGSLCFHYLKALVNFNRIAGSIFTIGSFFLSQNVKNAWRDYLYTLNILNYASLGVLNVTYGRWWMDIIEVDDTFNTIKACIECYYACS